MSISVIIPTLQAGSYLPNLLAGLHKQKVLPTDIIVIDSSSSDDTIAVADKAGCKIQTIHRATFNHGATRNLGAKQSRSNILVFMTQDAIPKDEHCLEELIRPIETGEAAATFARQVPNEDAGPLERFAREFNYPPHSKTKELRDVELLGYKAFFFSNVCSAVDADVFWTVGAFPDKVIVNEDVIFCAKLLRAGYAVKYTAEAQVYHHHNYNLRQQFKRNFDIGVSVSQAGKLLEGARTFREGLHFVLAQAAYIVQSRRYSSLYKVFTEAAVKLIGFKMGMQERMIPCALKRWMSMQKFFWKC